MVCSLKLVMGWIVLSPKCICGNPHPWYLRIAPFGKWGLDRHNYIISYIKMSSFWRRVAPNPIGLMSLRKGEIWKQAHTQGECHVTRQADLPQAKECQSVSEPPEAGKAQWNRSSFPALRKNQPCQQADLRLWSLQNSETNFRCWSHPVCGTFLQQP